MKRFTTRGATIAYITIGRSPDGTSLHLIWAHGWGQDHRALVAMARALEPLGTQILLDFPGFGSSPPPPIDWGTADYADALADSLGILPRRLRILIGYSFGCRIGLQLAARYPDTIDGLFLIAAAGLHQSKTPLQRLKLGARTVLFESLGLVGRIGVNTTSIRDRLESADLRAAGPMKATLVKVHREDLTDIVPKIRCPVHLVYGALDQNTPPEIGRRLEALLPNGRFVILPTLGHNDILTSGAHLLQDQLQQFLNRVESWHMPT
jgi:pimeloyl-ACP methyl ester carboxylesterase